ncbi:MAG: hypothetical protein LBR98_08815 [Syntrophomonadaceae bacterium]|nr:hypothetical protein [Syntrophomonadaceae bacterium]
MNKPGTNFAQLLKLLGARPRDVCEATGANKAVVSRWMSGKVKLMPGHGWIDKVADFMLALDERLREPVIPNVLAAYYPDETLAAPERRRAALIGWLATTGHRQSEYQEKGLAGLILEKVRQLSAPEGKHTLEPPPMKNAVVYGLSGVQGSVLQFLEMATAQKTPIEMQFACPEGLDMLTRSRKFHPRFMEAVMGMFEAGHRMSVVVRTDYRVSDIAEFSGRWLVAHLMGYVRSFYYDDFVATSRDKILAVVPGVMAGRVSETEDGQLYAAIQFDSGTIEEIQSKIKEYQAKSKQRFHYHLFEQPDDFLRGIHPLPDRPHYQFARLPHFCVAEEEPFQAGFSLSDDEMERVRLDFAPFLSRPVFFTPDVPACHIFCENDIEDALLKNRHRCPELTAILGRRVFMRTQTLVDRLCLIKKLLEEYPHYEVCFLRDEHFRKLTMQVAAWGDKAAIGWIAGGKSTACGDYTNVNALTGFCAAIWNTIPGMMKSRRTAISKINTWLKMAEKYGYAVGG